MTSNELSKSKCILARLNIADRAADFGDDFWPLSCGGLRPKLKALDTLPNPPLAPP